MEDIINFYTRDRPPPIDESFCSDFPYCEDLDSFDPITIDELISAFKISAYRPTAVANIMLNSRC